MGRPPKRTRRRATEAGARPPRKVAVGRPEKPGKLPSPHDHQRAAGEKERDTSHGAGVAQPEPKYTFTFEHVRVGAPGVPMGTKRLHTILLVQGTNELTGRPIRIYITPTDKLICVETLGQLARS